MNIVKISATIQNKAKEMKCNISSAECDELAHLIVDLVNEQVNEIINKGFTNVWNKCHLSAFKHFNNSEE